MKKAVFLDRDGVLIEDRGYLDNTEDIVYLPNVEKNLKKLIDRGFILVIVSNQSGIGRGLISREIVDQQNQIIADHFREYGVEFAAIKICPHKPEDECECRKPKPGMLLEAAEELNIDFARSWLVGDKESDILAGCAVGCRTIYFSEEIIEEAHYFSTEWDDASRVIRILDY